MCVAAVAAGKDGRKRPPFVMVAPPRVTLLDLTGPHEVFARAARHAPGAYVDGKLVSAAGITARIDGALALAALLRGERVAQEIQLVIQYAPEPAVRDAVTSRFADPTARRHSTAAAWADRPWN